MRRFEASPDSCGRSGGLGGDIAPYTGGWLCEFAMLTLPQNIQFGGALAIVFAITDPFRRSGCHHVSFTGSVFELVVKDENNNEIDELHTISNGVNASWWGMEDWGDDVDAIVSCTIPQAQTAALEFQAAAYTVWVTYPNGQRFALIGGPLTPESVVEPTV